MFERRPYHWAVRSLSIVLVVMLPGSPLQVLARESMRSKVTCFSDTVSGTCFHDADGNGVLGQNERGVPGIVLSLQRINLLLRVTEIATTVSDAEGRYVFAGLPGGCYLVEAQNTTQWECSGKKPQWAIVSRFIKCRDTDIAFREKAGMPWVHITADPSDITRGESTTLIWTSENADTARIDQGIGEVALNGTLMVAPEQTTVYTITVERDSARAQDRTTVVVGEPQTTTSSRPTTSIVPTSTTSSRPTTSIVPTSTTSSSSTTTTIPEFVQESFVLSEFYFNSMDTHMYWDGAYLWLPETDYLTSAVRFSTNLIRLNPDDFTYTRYRLPSIDYNGTAEYPIVYEVVPSLSNGDILYISAPYGQPKAIYVFDKSNEVTHGYRLVNGDLAYGGSNGGRMAVTVSNGNDTVWITCNDSKIATFDVASATMTALHDFSGIAPGGLYGIAAVPAVTEDTYLIHVASFGGKLLIFPSNLISVNQSMTIDIAEYGVSESALTALIYDEPYIWVAGHGNDGGCRRLFFMRYTPSSQFDAAGECAFFWSNLSTGLIPSIVSYGNWVFAVVENFEDCYLRYLIRLDKTTGVVDAVEIAFQNPRIAASLGHDGDGNIYAGGFGCWSKTFRPLELVRFVGLAVP